MPHSNFQKIKQVYTWETVNKMPDQFPLISPKQLTLNVEKYKTLTDTLKTKFNRRLCN